MPRLCRSIVPLPALALAACLLLMASGIPSAAAEAPVETVPEGSLLKEKSPLEEASPLGEKTPADQESPPAGKSPIEETIEETAEGAVKTLDTTHAYLERSILERVVWFDEFFGNVKTEDARHPEYLLRWRNSVRWEEGGKFKYRTSVRASLRLPKISNRLHLVITGENEAEPSPGLPDDPGNPGFDRTLANTRLVNTELRYGLIRRPDIDLFFGAGIRVTLPLESFVRGRFQFTRRLGERSLARFAETVFWKNEDGLGETTEVVLERKLGRRMLLRWSNSGTLSEISKGLEWGSEVSLLRELSPKSAITLAAGAFGATRPAVVVESYKTYTRYRRNFLRPWLFFELEPEVTWTRTPPEGYLVAFAGTLRLEFVFHGAGDTVTGAQPPKPP